MTFEKIGSVSVQANVTQTLLEKILSGEMAPGYKFPPERELAALLGVSRGTLHQSILDLSAKGFLEVVPRHGTVVIDYRENPTPQSLSVLMSYGSDSMSFSLFKDLMATRRLIEVEAAKLACQNMSSEALNELKEIVNRLDSYTGVLYEDVFRFHYNIVKSCGNSVYFMIYRGFEPILLTLIKKHYDLRPEDIGETIRLNRFLIRCFERKDEAGAMNAMRSLLDLGVDTLKEKY